jgi:hypothetical protein
MFRLQISVTSIVVLLLDYYLLYTNVLYIAVFCACLPHFFFMFDTGILDCLYQKSREPVPSFCSCGICTIFSFQK